MAKVKGFNPPVTKLLYEEKSGILHYFGEFFRMIFGEGSVSPRDPDTDYISKSRRGERPAEQGEGTYLQNKYRTHFKNCTLLWNSLPEECPDPLPDPPPTSKKSVWDAKLEHGVTCTYYDLFMKCCIKWAVGHGGAMPVGDCFPCEKICEHDLAYDYEASAETIDQSDSVTVAIKGSDGPFNWSVSGQGFTLDHEQTTGLTNTLNANGSACGSAIIVVTDTCEGSVVGYVRCTAGSWGAWQDGCVLEGTPDSKIFWHDILTLEKTQGKYNQKQKLVYSVGIGMPGCDGTDCLAHCNEGLPGCIGCIDCLDWSCTDMGKVDCGGWCCGFTACGYGEIGYCICVSYLKYREWVC